MITSNGGAAGSKLTLSFRALLALLATVSTGTAACGGSESATGGGTTASPESCDAASADGIAVAPSDVYGGVPYSLGYPPYAIHGCRLAYVEPAGSLRLRDLATGDDTLVAPASEKPRRPAISGALIAWEADLGDARAVRMREGDVTFTALGNFDHAGEPRAADDGVVFTGFLSADDLGDTDVFFAVPGKANAVPIASGPGQQRFADISATHVAFADFSEDPDGTFDQNATDLADIVLYDRAKKTITKRERDGKQAFALLGAEGKVAYLSWGPDHPEPKFSAYQLLVGDLDAPATEDEVVTDITTSMPYVRPTAAGARLEWIQWPMSEGATLWRRPADFSTAAEVVPGLSAQSLYGPSASSSLTVVASKGPGESMTLKAAEH